jgi:phosphate/sulfate permease
VSAVLNLVGAFLSIKVAATIAKGILDPSALSGTTGLTLVSLAHGTNDAPKTMGVITLALIAHGDIDANHFYVPIWVKLACALAIAAGTAIGGWRIINTMGNRITDVESPQGFSAEASSAADGDRVDLHDSGRGTDGRRPSGSVCSASRTSRSLQTARPARSTMWSLRSLRSSA